MSDDAEVNIHELIKKDINPAADGLIKEQKEMIAKLAKVMMDLTRAIDKPDIPTVKLLLKTLNAESGQVANRLSRTAKLLQRLEEAETDEFDGDLKEAEDMTAKLSALETKLKGNYITIKEYQDKAADAIAAGADVEGDAAEAWAEHEAWLRAQLEDCKERLADIQKLSEKAQKAADSRDDSGLKETINQGTALRDAQPTTKRIRDTFAKFCEDVHPEKLSKDLQDQFARDRAKFQKLVDEFAATNEQIAKIQAEMEKLELKPIDPKKVSSLFKIPTQYDSKVRKALELDETAAGKALEAILKEMKMPLPAKEIMSRMEKARLV